jgi:hypothetical protein
MRSQLISCSAGLAVLAVLSVACGDSGAGPPPPVGGELTVDSIRPALGTTAELWPKVTVYFSDPLDPTTVTGSSLTITQAGNGLPTTFHIAPDGQSVTLDAPLLPATTYTVSATTAVRATTGTPLTPFQSTFTTRTPSPISIVTLSHSAIQRLVPDVSGRAHLVTLDPAGGTLYYSTCTTACGAPGSWQTLIIDDSATGYSVSAALDQSRRLHVVYSADTSNDLRYATCSANCGLSANWSHTVIDSGSRSGMFASIAVDSGGALHALYSNWDDGKLHYAVCSTGCTLPASWASGTLPEGLLSMQDVAIAVSPSGQVHAAYRGQAVGTGANLTKYATCSSSCTTSANWHSVTLTSTSMPGSGSDLQLDASGVLYHAYYTGLSGLRYTTCGANCLQSASWASADVDPSGSGVAVSLARHPGGRMVIAYAGQAGGLALRPPRPTASSRPDLATCGLSAPTNCAGFRRVLTMGDALANGRSRRPKAARAIAHRNLLAL